jgi:hypothetical protein
VKAISYERLTVLIEQKLKGCNRSIATDPARTSLHLGMAECSFETWDELTRGHQKSADRARLLLLLEGQCELLL